MLFIITFFIIFGWKTNSIIDISAITGCVLAVQYAYFYKPWEKLKNNPPTISLLILAIYSFIIVISNGITDFLPVMRAFRALTMLIAGFSLYNLYKKHYKKPIQTICTHIYFSILIHGIIMIAMYISEPLRHFVYSITFAESYVNLKSPFLEGYRICGLTYGLSQTAMVQIFGLFLMPYVFEKQNSLLKKMAIILSFPIIIISSILAGRSGLFATLLFLPIYLSLKLLNSKISFTTFFSYVKFVIICSISLSILFYAAYHYLPKKFVSNALYNTKEIIDVFKNKSIIVNEVKPMYFLPNNPITALFGMGNYGRSDYFYLLSDVGWIKSIFAIGLIGTIFMIQPFIWGILKCFKHRRILGELAIAAILIFSSSILLNSKELSLLTRNQWTIQAILISIISIDYSKKDSLK